MPDQDLDPQAAMMALLYNPRFTYRVTMYGDPIVCTFNIWRFFEMGGGFVAFSHDWEGRLNPNIKKVEVKISGCDQLEQPRCTPETEWVEISELYDAGGWVSCPYCGARRFPLGANEAYKQAVTR